jgi:hypothetical protein
LEYEVNSKFSSFNQADPWTTEVNGTELLNEIRDLFKRYAVLPTCAPEFLALWVVHTHCIEAADHTPYVAVMSQDPECGKTTVMKLLAALASKPRTYSDISTASLYREIDEEEPTLFIDELDAFMRGNNENYHAVRGILNSGFERSPFATVGRAEEYINPDAGKSFRNRAYSTFCPKALAGIQNIPDTVRSRSVVIWMQKNNSIQLPRATTRRIARETVDLRRKIVRWAQDNIDTLEGIEEPRKMPRQLSNRAFDRWCPLVAIADVAGGHWRRTVRHTAVTLEKANFVPSTGVHLLIDIRDYCKKWEHDESHLVSASALYKHLLQLEQWQAMENGKALHPRGLAQTLEGYGVKRKRRKDGRGWLMKDLLATFKNYLRADEEWVTD